MRRAAAFVAAFVAAFAAAFAASGKRRAGRRLIAVVGVVAVLIRVITDADATARDTAEGG